MRVMVACEFSGIVRTAFESRGHDAWSCDLRPSELPGNHIQGDILDVALEDYDLLIAHPPCTTLANSGVRWLKDDPDRFEEMETDALFFNYFLEAPVHYICVENPIQHYYAIERINQKHNQVIHPWQFGHRESKTTWLWLKNLPPLEPSTPEYPGALLTTVHRTANRNSDIRAMDRARTYTGIAEAMANQWGVLQPVATPVR